MEWLVFALTGGGTALAGRYLWDLRAARRRAARELEQTRLLADDDVTHLGEELGRLDAALSGRPLDTEAHADYQAALDSYESARRAVTRLESADAIASVADTLTDGRFALACVRARVAGEPLPERRVPCFFNPQHGPSAVDVVWTPPTGGTRRVAACAQDAARLRAGEDPVVRPVQYVRTVPTWEAGALIEPYSASYFASSSARAAVMGLSMDLRGEGGGRWGSPWRRRGHPSD
ncbi:hypothetical protein FB561_5356 [Kribbella amoyensis]|uniref:Uncharacterized protein n=1 Tax=Kribbella amoyensis TaxID=996641 RepID=A0A561BZ91_9ACTN|nr:hypothetical protein [Kribbella amoyensis]TWD84181.1 hypothetical protein FB561_5356 [Kribbella amoyensis]